MKGELGEDYTKHWWYVCADLCLKVLSTIAIVVLGAAGWRLQRDASATRDKSENLEREQRKYLPALQTLRDLQIASAMSTIHLDERPTDRSLAAHLLRDDAVRISFAGESLFLPDVDILAHLTPAERFLTMGNASRGTETELRSAAIMLSELLRTCADAQGMRGRDLTFAPNGRGIFLIVPGKNSGPFDPVEFLKGNRRRALSVSAYIKTDNRTTSLWTQWLPASGLPADAVCSDSARGLTEDVGWNAAMQISRILALHPDIAEKYASLRSSTFDPASLEK
jgi:hypothetical protein